MPSLNNLIPMQYLGTTPTAGPILGIIASVIMFVLGLLYTKYAVKKTITAGEGFLPTGAVISARQANAQAPAEDQKAIPFILSLIPPAAVIVILNVVKFSPETAMLIGCLLCCLINWKSVSVTLIKTIGSSFADGGNVTVVTSCIVGFGSVVSGAPGFITITKALDSVNIAGPFLIILITAVMCGITGSSSGGLSVAYNAFLERFLATGLNPQVIHRLSAVASNSLDSLPHSSATVVGLEALGLTHSEAYSHCFWTTVVIPMVAAVITAIICGPLAALGIY